MSYETRIGHVHLKVRDLGRAVDFYTRHFSLRVVEQLGDHYAFLTGGDMHHEIALQNVGANAPASPAYGVGLYHVAFEVPSARAFALAYQQLHADGVRVALVDHVISWAMYFSDPDGNGLEIYWDTRDQPGGSPAWDGRNLPISIATLEKLLDE